MIGHSLRPYKNIIAEIKYAVQGSDTRNDATTHQLPVTIPVFFMK